MLSAAPSAFAEPPWVWRLLEVDCTELKEIEINDSDTILCHDYISQPGPIKSCFDAKGDVGKIGDKVVCKMPPREVFDKPKSTSTKTDPKLAKRPPPVYPNDYPDEAKTLPPPRKDVFYPTEAEAKQFKSLNLKERAKAQQSKGKKPPPGLEPMPTNPN